MAKVFFDKGDIVRTGNGDIGIVFDDSQALIISPPRCPEKVHSLRIIPLLSEPLLPLFQSEIWSLGYHTENILNAVYLSIGSKPPFLTSDTEEMKIKFSEEKNYLNPQMLETESKDPAAIYSNRLAINAVLLTRSLNQAYNIEDLLKKITRI